MPEDMSDRMPEDMPDRMPEDLPVRKCINVMVGITRSKVIFNYASKDMCIYIYIYIGCFDPTQYVFEIKEQDVRCSHDSTVGLLQNKLKPDPIV